MKSLKLYKDARRPNEHARYTAHAGVSHRVDISRETDHVSMM